MKVSTLKDILAQMPDNMDVVIRDGDTGAYMRVKQVAQLSTETDQADEPIRFWPAGADIEFPVIVLVLR